MRALFLLNFVLCFFVFQLSAFGWGAGHNSQVTLILNHLPEEIKSHFSKKDIDEMVSHHSHYPDSFDKFGKEVSEEVKALLKAYGIKNRFILHKSVGQAAEFMILTKLFKQKDYHQATLWLAAIAHSLGDAGANNHHPLIAFHTYAFSQDKAIKLVDGTPFKRYLFGSLSGTFAQKEGKKAIYDMMKGYKPKLLVEPGENMNIRALVKFLDIDYKAADIMSDKTALILDGAVMKLNAKTAEEKEKGLQMTYKGWAYLCAEPAKMILDAIYTSYYLAENGFDYSVADFKLAMKEHKKSFEREMKNRALSLDSIYKGLLRPYDNKKARVMVLLEPTYTMNYAQFGFEAKYFAAAVMRLLKEKNISYVTVDVRDLMEKDFPPVSEIPILVVPTRRNPYTFHRYKSNVINGKIASYVKSGGKLIQIGQGIMRALAKLNNAKVDSKHKYFPVERKNAVGTQITIDKIQGPDNQIVRTITATPFTPAGWHRPNIRHVIKSSSEEIIPFGTLRSSGEEFIIAAFQKNDKGQINGAFIPEMILMPFIFEEKTLRFPGEAELDLVGDTIFLAVLETMEKTEK